MTDGFEKWYNAILFGKDGIIIDQVLQVSIFYIIF